MGWMVNRVVSLVAGCTVKLDTLKLCVFKNKSVCACVHVPGAKPTFTPSVSGMFSGMFQAQLCSLCVWET